MEQAYVFSASTSNSTHAGIDVDTQEDQTDSAVQEITANLHLFRTCEHRQGSLQLADRAPQWPRPAGAVGWFLTDTSRFRGIRRTHRTDKTLAETILALRFGLFSLLTAAAIVEASVVSTVHGGS